MRIVFCDDDPAIAPVLEAMLREYFDAAALPQPEYAAYLSGKELLAGEPGTDGARPDVAFLDVEMPGLSGIAVGAELQKRCPYCKIFILTSYADYLDEAMRFHVFRYLSKPLDKARLFRNMKDAIYQLSVDTRPVLVENQDGAVTLYADEIVMVEAQGRKVVVYTQQREYQALRNMRHWEQVLGDIASFYQTHRSFIINMKYVRSFSPNLISLARPDSPETQWTAYVARRRLQGFKNTYMLYLEAMR